MCYNNAEIIHNIKQIVGSKWCLLVVRRKVIHINLYSSEIIPEKRYKVGGGGERSLRPGRPHSEPGTGSRGGSLINWQ